MLKSAKNFPQFRHCSVSWDALLVVVNDCNECLHTDNLLMARKTKSMAAFEYLKF
jgi:hypothetical protein